MILILEFVLLAFAKAVVKKYRPIIIGVTGSVGKTSTKEAIYFVVKSKFNARRSLGNLNSPLGVSLTVLGDFYGEYVNQSPWVFWPRVILRSFKVLLFKTKYPEILILELGADRPGDIKSFARLLKPKIGVITEIGEVPAHVEFYSGPEHLAQEKSALIAGLPSNGFAILNTDDDTVLDMQNKTNAKILRYGFGEGVDVKITDVAISEEEEMPVTKFKLSYGFGFIPIRIQAIGKSQAYASAAAASVGIALGMNLVEIAQGLKDYKVPNGRLNIIKGLKNTKILDDTYNASPSSMHLALDILGDLKARRKVAILGDMLELGEFTEEAHRKVGNLAAERADLLICVGSRAIFIADSASNQMPQENILRFDDSEEVKNKVKELIEEGDLILIKGSQAMRMEKIVEELMADPENAAGILIRQGLNWKKK